MNRTSVRITASLVLGGITLAVGPALGRAQTASPSAPKVYRACYVPTTGTVYRIGESGMPTTCARSTHVEFSWVSEGPPGPPARKVSPVQPGP